jgi:arylsulfatase A-like enzyme
MEPPRTARGAGALIVGAAREKRDSMQGLVRLAQRGLALCAIVLIGVACERAAERSARSRAGAPDVLVLLLDTTRADRLGLYGYARPTSPAIDALAREARVFERAIASSNWTLPSHASLFTGLPPHAHGAVADEGWLRDEVVTLAERFRDAGYATYLFSANPFVSAEHNLAQGFEIAEHPWQPEWQGAVRAYMQARAYPGESEDSRFAPFKDAGEVIRRGFARWLAERDDDRPYFAFLNFMEAHRPYYATRDERARFLSPAQVELSVRMEHRYSDRHAYSFGALEIAGDELAATAGLYDAALSHLDEIIGGIASDLRAAGRLDRTLLAITADHGEHLGDHHRLGHEFSLYDALIRVPLVLRYPPRVPVGREPRAVAQLDLRRTLLELAGLEADAQDRGRSLLAPASEGEAARWLLAESLEVRSKPIRAVQKRFPDLDLTPWKRAFRAVERGRIKLIEGEGGRRELYDLAADPAEMRDLAAQRPEVVAEFAAQLDALRAGARPSETRAPSGAEHEQLLESLGYIEERDSRSP